MCLYKKLSFLWIMLLCCFTTHIVLAKEKVKFEGHVASGMKYLQRDVYGFSYYYGKLRMETELDDNIKTVLDFRGRSETNEVELKSAYLRIQQSPGVFVKIGNVKKRFTAEEMDSKEDLPTIETSLLNRHLEPFGFVVRGMGITLYRKYENKGLPVGYRTGIYYNESRHMYSLLRLEHYKIGPFQRMGLGCIYRKPLSRGEKTVMAFSADLAFKAGRFRSEIEGVWGQDPVESYYRILKSIPETAAFTGGKLLITYSQPFKYKFLKAIEPVLLFSFLAPDTDEFEVHQIQCLTGLNVYIHKKVRIRINNDLIFANNALDTSVYATENSKFFVEVQTRW